MIDTISVLTPVMIPVLDLITPVLMIFSNNWRLLHSTTICRAEHNLVYYVLLCCAGPRVNIVFKHTDSIHFKGLHNSNDGGIKLLWNIGQYLPYYMVQYPRRQPSSHSLPLETQISPNIYTNEHVYVQEKYSLHLCFAMEPSRTSWKKSLTLIHVFLQIRQTLVCLHNRYLA
jgi:hypothetical protein